VTTPLRFALVGAAGFVAPRHLEAIHAVGGQLVAALDPHDAVGVLDRYARNAEFFTDEYRFERWLEKQRLAETGIDWLVVCSPNYMHDRHIRMGLWSGAKVLCEKPLVVNPDNLDRLAELEDEFTDRPGEQRVFTVLQLRHVSKLQSMHYAIQHHDNRRFDVKLHYATPRGAWYRQSWKGDVEKSGGLITNIGIHMFDLLVWLFGPGDVLALDQRSPTRARGTLRLQRASVDWLLSTDVVDTVDGRPERWIEVDGYRTEFAGFEGLHTTVYEETLAGRGHGIADARPAVELVAKLRGRLR
jgi:UDP-N-acetyl-2-amino-2-deoxyglucuronate dehydrogenase